MNGSTAVVPVDPGRMLALLEVGCRHLAEAKDARDAMLIRDQAQAMRVWYKQRHLSLEAINDAAELKLWAERRIGEILREMPKAEGGRPTKTGSIVEPVSTTLSEIGLDKKQSHRFQAVASVPIGDFQAHLQSTREAGKEITTAAVYKLAKSKAKEAKAMEREKEAVKHGCVIADLHQAAEEGRRYGTFYIDPPWDYDNQATRASTGNHYGTMPLDEIAALPVGKLAADNCHLHLWTTNAFLFDCPRLFDAWGFKYQGVFVWCKPQMGIGNCWRVSHEFMLLAIRGEPRSFAVHDLTSWAAIDRGKHSAKPDKVRLMVERASPGPRLELFAREDTTWRGWDVWGNQIERSIFTKGADDE